MSIKRQEERPYSKTATRETTMVGRKEVNVEGGEERDRRVFEERGGGRGVGVVERRRSRVSRWRDADSSHPGSVPRPRRRRDEARQRGDSSMGTDGQQGRRGPWDGVGAGEHGPRALLYWTTEYRAIRGRVAISWPSLRLSEATRPTCSAQRSRGGRGA